MDSMDSFTTFDLSKMLHDAVKSVEDPTLPALPTFAPKTVNKKRSRDEYLASSSDAPLFSSDDLPASSAENYNQPRVKRQHRRTWFETEEGSGSVSVSSSKKKLRMKGPFRRTHDSAVWMASDESTESEEIDRQDAVRRTLKVIQNGGSIDRDDELGLNGEREVEVDDTIHEGTQTLKEKLQKALVNKALRLTEDPGGFQGPVFPYWQKQPDQLMGFHATQEIAQKKVAFCIDEGREVVDLSYVVLL